MRWAFELSRFLFKIVHQPGTKAVVPDALSRKNQDLPKGLDDERLQGRFHQLLNSKKGALLLNSLSTISETPIIYHVRIGAIWVIGGNENQKENEKPSRTETFVFPFAELKQKLRNL
jgi:hypothetical protein